MALSQEQKTEKPSYYTHILLVIIFMLLSVSGYVTWRFFSSKVTKFAEIVMCVECKHIFLLEHTPKVLPPYECVRCHKKSAYKAYECARCRIYFPGQRKNLDGNIECPRCFSDKKEDVKELLTVPELEIKENNLPAK